MLYNRGLHVFESKKKNSPLKLHPVKYSEIELQSGSADRMFDILLYTECVRLATIYSLGLYLT